MDKKQMEQNIKDYAKQVVTIDEFVKAVRQTPGMYIGPLGNQGFINMTREVYQNSIDELIKTISPCTKVFVCYDERTNEVIVQDNGRGIPFNDIIRIFSKEHTSSNYQKQKGQYSSGLHGLGSKVTNALSSIFIVESYILGEARKVIFYDGRPWEDGIIEIPNTDNLQGTRITFRPCYDIMGNITITINEVLHLIKCILYLTPLGSIVEFKGIFKDGKEYNENIVNSEGLVSFLIMQTTSPLIAPIVVSDDTGYMKGDVAFTFDSQKMEGENIIAYGNFCPTVSGTHITGFIDGVCKYFRDYMNKIYLGNNKKKLNIVNNDIKAGLVGAISVCHLKPIFTGQAKEILSNEDLYPFISKLVYTSLDEWSKANPKDLQKLCKYFKDIAEVRVKSEAGKVKLANKYQSNALSGLPSKFIKPKDRSVELFIVEGDSASGSAKNSRDNRFQGLYPIRGKLPNALTTTREKFLSNEEVAGIITIVGGGYGRNFDLSKVPWEKIIFGADADPDGKHISSLLLKLFIVYMPEMIKAGRVYKAVPPLYGIEKPNGKSTYFTTRLDYVDYIQKLFTKNNTIASIRGTQLTKEEIMNILYNNIDYTYIMETIANRYAVNPLLLETTISNLNSGFDNLRNIIKSNYRFVDVEKERDTIIIKGLIDNAYQTLFINDKLINDIKIVEAEIEKNDSLMYNMNGEKCSLYSLMKTFEKSAPKGITRYKGLGEMDPKQLAESTLSVQNRTLIRYNMEDAVKEIETIKYLESNRKELTKGLTASRTDLLG